MVVNGVQYSEKPGSDGCPSPAATAPSPFLPSALPSALTAQAKQQHQLFVDTLEALKLAAQRSFGADQACYDPLVPLKETYTGGGLYGLNCNYEVGYHGIQGRQAKSEDYVLHLALGPGLFVPFNDCTRACLACVCDGHGGTGAVAYVAERFPAYLLQDLARLRTAPAAALVAVLHRLDEELVAAGHNSGTTVNAVLVVDNTVTVVNTGDCRAILYDWVEERAEQITQDHNLQSNRERERVLGEGAELSTCGSYVVLPQVCEVGGAGAGGEDAAPKLLGVTKALGHASVKSFQRSLSSLSSLGSFQGSLPTPGRAAVAAGGAGAEAGAQQQALRQKSGGGGGGDGRVRLGAVGCGGPAGGAGSGSGTASGTCSSGPGSDDGSGNGCCGSPCAPAAAAAAASNGSAGASGPHGHPPSPRTVHFAVLPPSPSAAGRAPLPVPGGHGRSLSASGPAGRSPPRSVLDGVCGLAPQPTVADGAVNGSSNGALATANGSIGTPVNGSSSNGVSGAGAHAPGGDAAVTGGSNGLHAGVPTAPSTSPFAPAAEAGPAGGGGGGTVFGSAAHLVAAEMAAAATAAGCGTCDGDGPAPSGQFQLTCTPDVFEFTIQDDRHVLLLGCDGVFDRMANTEACRAAVRTMCSSNSCQDAAREVTHRACKLGSIDNITALVLRFGRKPIVRRQSCSVLSLMRRSSSNTSSDLASQAQGQAQHATGGGLSGLGAGGGGAGGAAGGAGGGQQADDSGSPLSPGAGGGGGGSAALPMGVPVPGGGMHRAPRFTSMSVGASPAVSTLGAALKM